MGLMVKKTYCLAGGGRMQHWTCARHLGIRKQLFLAGTFKVSKRMKALFQFFTWWNGQTLNTRLHTWLKGERVGEDEFGNIYYRTKGGKLDPALGFERRWVIYQGQSEGSMTPPGWYGWLHHTVDTPPTRETYAPRAWEQPHLPNMTGTDMAWRPEGSTLRSGERPAASGDYTPWTPNA